MQKNIIIDIDAVTAALTGCIHLWGKAELIGDEEEGYIVVPTRRRTGGG